jgi:hypothetical protein
MPPPQPIAQWMSCCTRPATRWPGRRAAQISVAVACHSPGRHRRIRVTANYCLRHKLTVMNMLFLLHRRKPSPGWRLARRFPSDGDLWAPAPTDTDYAVVWAPPPEPFWTKQPRHQALFNIGAGDALRNSAGARHAHRAAGRYRHVGADGQYVCRTIRQNRSSLATGPTWRWANGRFANHRISITYRRAGAERAMGERVANTCCACSVQYTAGPQRGPSMVVCLADPEQLNSFLSECQWSIYLPPHRDARHLNRETRNASCSRAVI